MRAQIALTPTESKLLIARAIARMEIVRRAIDNDRMIVMHPSSSTYFVAQELTGQKPRINRWLFGITVPKGTCLEIASLPKEDEPKKQKIGSAENFTYSWVIKGNELVTGLRLGDLLKEMEPSDIYIKGVNALDPDGNAGVLFAHPTGGTIGRVMAAYKRKRFNVILPVGLEKMIPVPIEDAAKAAKKKGLDYSMGVNCGLMPCRGTVITEIEAIKILSGANATPIASGGLEGAEGSVVIVIQGEKSQVQEAIQHAEQVKGAKLPQVRIPNCYECFSPLCDFPIGDKPWV